MANLIDKKKLLDHLKLKREHNSLLIYAVLEGLRTAIERGDFDYVPDPIAVSNHEESQYFNAHPIQDDAGYGVENEENSDDDAG